MTSTPPGYQQNPAPKSGGKKWVLFGCGGCLGLIALGIAGVVGFVFVVLGAIKQTDAYKIALSKAQNSPALQAAIGTPIKENFFSPMGSASTNNGAGEANIILTLEGTNGRAAVVTATASKPAGGEWQFSVLNAKVAPSGPDIDLLTEGQPADPAAAPATAPATQN